jgi:hypothetical protein
MSTDTSSRVSMPRVAYMKRLTINEALIEDIDWLWHTGCRDIGTVAKRVGLPRTAMMKRLSDASNPVLPDWINEETRERREALRDRAFPLWRAIVAKSIEDARQRQIEMNARRREERWTN